VEFFLSAQKSLKIQAVYSILTGPFGQDPGLFSPGPRGQEKKTSFKGDGMSAGIPKTLERTVKVHMNAWEIKDLIVQSD